MPIRSAGILLFRRKPDLELLLVHPGGPYWRGKDRHAWTIPKGIVGADEDHLTAAKREFQEETGWEISGRPHALGTFKLYSGKLLEAWAVEGDGDPETMKSNSFSMIWPPNGGRLQSFPEIDRGSWFKPEEARIHITKGQLPLVDALLHLLSAGRKTP
ncbi:MAG TPA: NUDIX domain-containing protein [Rhizomicrobium sp.]|nr:NUDIX domain-containing protein [Rhizomicrobium sp.]